MHSSSIRSVSCDLCVGVSSAQSIVSTPGSCTCISFMFSFACARCTDAQGSCWLLSVLVQEVTPVTMVFRILDDPNQILIKNIPEGGSSFAASFVDSLISVEHCLVLRLGCVF